jgi:signal transduction histidine kinase
MARLYLRIYLALMGSLLVFALIATAHWHLRGGNMDHSAYMPLITFGSLALCVGVVAYPIVRQLTRRLERLQRGVESLGAGDLSARVPVEGRDEIAQLADSFNRAAERIEILVTAHKSLLANASHELRTPLARIRMAVELMKESADAKRKAGLDQDIAELDQLIDEILLASRLDAVSELQVDEEMDLLAIAAEECSRYHDVEVDGASALVRGDPRLLRRLLRNLLENTFRHGAAPVSVRLIKEGVRVNIVVTDQGSPIPEAQRTRLFEPFYRRTASTGAGLGLALVLQIAQRHGGSVRYISTPEAPNSFVVSLPLQK